MKFLLDANIPYSTRQVFRKEDKVVHVRDIGLGDAEDVDIFARALTEKAVIVTRDLDFANTMLYPVEMHAGVIVLRVPPYFSAAYIKKILRTFLLKVDRRLLSGNLVIVEPGRYRVRTRKDKGV